MSSSRDSVAIRAATSYIPAMLVEEIAAGRRAPRSRGETLRGPVMFVDVAGFTPFVLSLCAQGQQGVEALQRVLTRCFTGLVDCIYDHGGDVFHFAGDSMLVGFVKQRAESDADSVARAATCATAIRSLMQAYESFEALGRRYSMLLKTGLAFGDYHYLLIGEERFWLTPLILGKPIDSAIDAERHAAGGDILLDRDTWSRLPSPKQGAPLNGFMKLQSAIERGAGRGGGRERASGSLDSDIVASCSHYIEPVLLEKVLTSHSGFEGDFREVTCLFVRYGGFRVGDDVNGAMSTLNELYSFVQENARTYRAVINRVELGDKGFVFLFILGAPNAMENKCNLASRLAMALMHPPASAGATTQAGIATGYGYCGDVGAPYRKEYTVTGEVVNLASRLMTYAENGGIYLDDSTRARLDRRLIATEIPNVALKGIPDVTTIFRLHSEGRHGRERAPARGERMVGRTRELETMRALLAEARGGSGRTCLITGDAGLGKSRFASDFIDEIGTDEASVYLGSCYAHEQFTPYSAWKGLLQDFLHVPDKAGPAEAQGVIVRHLAELDGVSTNWAPVLAQAMGIAVEEDAFTRNLDPSQKTRRVFQIIGQLVQVRAAVEPVVICIDDVHWIDGVSMKLVEHVAATIRHDAVLLVLLSRDDRAVSQIDARAELRVLPLAGLTSDESRALLTEHLEGRVPAPELQRMVLERAEGNPFFIESIVRSLRDQDLLRTDKAGRVSVEGDFSKLRIPETVQDLILTRIDHLDESQKTVLRIASVIGRVFGRDVLVSLLPSSIDAALFDDTLGRLEELGFITPIEGDAGSYQFKHVLISDVAYGTLPLETRESLHRRTGEYIESSAATSGEEAVDLLSYHFLKANERDKGLDYAIRAGRHSAARFALADAIYHYSTALEILELDDYRRRADERTAVKCELADVCRQDGRYDQAMSLLVDCLEQPLPPLRRADVHICIGHVYQERGQAAQAIDELETGLSLLGCSVPRGGMQVRLAIVWGLVRRALLRMHPMRGAPPDDELRPILEKQHEIMKYLGNIYWFSDLKRTAWTIVAILNLSERLQSDEKLSMAYANFSMALLSRGLAARARKYSERSVALARKTGDPGVLSFALNRAAVFGIYCNEPLESARLYAENIRLLDQIGETWEKVTALGTMAAAYAMATEFARTDEIFAEVEALATELDSKMHLAWSKCWRPFYRYLLGLENAEDAKQEIRASIPFAIECNEFGTQCLAQGHLCAIAVREGEGEGAAWLADKAFSLLMRHRANMPVRTVQMAWVYAAEAAVHALESGVAGDMRSRCHVIVKRSLAHVEKVGRHFPLVLGPALRIDACYRALCKGDERSSAAFERAIRALEATPNHWQTGIAYRDAAKHMPEHAREYADKARALFERYHLSAELRRMDEVTGGA